ncbi:MAG TPA: NifB/NifX family molybdenum-iron cluster-binding protein [Spirochaetota bacterium]|nr:NifB/NifX family molybdenum-iron cluster-binding protein [Spirochaetota bacterium]HOD13834.1 NifB/NifX family molybdenum-iron cluster-binding protein [Spirochaetota bacterium]HPG51375.1 NifB/NifX family molybdenum-iron cluster-binding protein [Spirochaetota bacterium]HPN13901.1 NifB/NifX family molybdenum-iron cluster-binding protein [Spirochaetota bacterium]
MIIAVTTEGKTMKATIDERFGRASGFIIYNTDTGSHEYRENQQNLDAAQGAGIQSAKTVIDAGASVLITGNVGPKAHAALAAGGVEIYLKNGGTVNEAINDYRSGSLMKTSSANVEGHW